jgi:hypothetical protein
MTSLSRRGFLGTLLGGAAAAVTGQLPPLTSAATNTFPGLLAFGVDFSAGPDLLFPKWYTWSYDLEKWLPYDPAFPREPSIYDKIWGPEIEFVGEYLKDNPVHDHQLLVMKTADTCSPAHLWFQGETDYEQLEGRTERMTRGSRFLEWSRSVG